MDELCCRHPSQYLSSIFLELLEAGAYPSPSRGQHKEEYRCAVFASTWNVVNVRRTKRRVLLSQIGAHVELVYVPQTRRVPTKLS
jgi:hypothetical protein